MSDLSELFDRDPEKLSDQETAVIVARMRESMTNFELGVKPVPKAKPKSSKTLDILKDLGLA